MMKRLLSSFVAILLVSGVALAEGTWGVVPRMQESVVRLTSSPNEEGSFNTCASFAIHQRDGYFLTAAHCLEPELWLHRPFHAVDVRKLATVVWADSVLDVAVLQADLHVPALRPRAKDYARGLEVGALGFAWGQGLYFAAGAVANVHVYASWDNNGGRWKGEFLTVDGTVNGGMSGGPWFDRNGRVVGIVQRGNQSTTFGRSINTLFSATQAYWEHQR